MKAKVCKNCGQMTDMIRGPAKGPFKLWSSNCKEVNGCIPGEFEEVEVDPDATCIRCGNNVDYIKGIWVDPPNYNHKTKTFYDFCLERAHGWRI